MAVAIGRGCSNAEIAAQLYLSVPTVKTHVSRLFDKLAATNRVQIAIQVHDAGWIDPSIAPPRRTCGGLRCRSRR